MTVHEGPPPRQLALGSAVPGHDTVIQRRGAHQHAGTCTCGWRSRLQTQPSAVISLVAAHLAGAWPVLVAREEQEADASLLERIREALTAAEAELNRIVEADRLDKPVLAGEAFPVLSPEYMTATDRVEVLQHQLEELQARRIE